MKPNFILGVGCQKGGTTWLFKYLESHPDVMMSPTKEMHIFDTLFMPEMFGLFYKQSQSRVYRKLTRAIDEKQFNPKLNTDLQHELSRLNIYHDIQEYRHANMRKGIQAVGEISPTYAALDREHFRTIQSLLTENFNLKIVFLMRDPINRIQSQQRMIAKRNAKGGIQNPLGQDLHNLAFYTHKTVAIRTRYDKTIKNLESVFEPHDIFYGFYETLFESAEIKRLCDFLEIDFTEADFNVRVNVAPKLDHEPDLQVIRDARIYYEPVYRFCADKFTEVFIKKIWGNYSI